METNGGLRGSFLELNAGLAVFGDHEDAEAPSVVSGRGRGPGQCLADSARLADDAGLRLQERDETAKGVRGEFTRDGPFQALVEGRPKEARLERAIGPARHFRGRQPEVLYVDPGFGGDFFEFGESQARRIGSGWRLALHLGRTLEDLRDVPVTVAPHLGREMLAHVVPVLPRPPTRSVETPTSPGTHSDTS